MKGDKKPLIIVLSGTYGVGKTTLAHQLGIDLRIMNKFSGIASILKSMIPNSLMVKSWNKYDQTDIEYIKNKLVGEAKIIGEVVRNIANSAEKTGENYIIEGIQLLPEFLPMDKIFFLRIYVSDNSVHKKRFSQPSITRLRHKNNPSYTLTKNIEKTIQEECRKYPIFEVDNIGTPEESSKQIIKIIKDTHPDYLNEYLWFERDN